MEKSHAKISLPHISKVYNRERLFQVLDNHREQLATFISAPPGTGKTSLVASYIEERNIQYLWYQVDEGDEDLATFFYYLGLAFQNIDTGKKVLLPQLTAEYSFGINTFSKRYFQEIYHRLKKPFVLVFDNFQEISEGSSLHSILSTICMEIPEHGHIIFVSRQNPPPPFSRLLIHRDMSVLGWEDLRFSQEEIGGFLQSQGYPDTSEKDLTRIATQTDGWVAGLLHLQDKNNMSGEKKIGHVGTEATLFDYFAWEVFKNLDKDSQEVLLQSAFLPTMTADTVEGLTGKSDSSQILESMCQENYFTVRQGTGKVSYQYHPMFREFLLNRSHGHFPDKKIRSIKSIAANLLENQGELEDAISLLSELQDWTTMARIIIQNAPEYMSLGRYKTIEHWLGKFPKEVVKSNPWLLYWSGISHLWVNPVESQASIEQAYKVFLSMGDPFGLWLSWSGVVDSIFIAFREFEQFDAWVNVLDQLQPVEQLELPPDMGIRIATSMLAILAFRQPQNTRLKQTAEALLQRYKSAADQSLVLLAYSHLVTYFTWVGKFPDATVALIPLQKQEDPELLPMAGIIRSLSEAALQLNSGSAGKCVKTALEGLKSAETTGIHIWDTTLMQLAAYGSLQTHDFDQAKNLIQMASRFLDDNRINSTAFHHTVLSWQSLQTNNIKLAKQQGKKSLALSRLGGVPLFMILSYITYSHALIEDTQFAQAENQIDKAVSIAKGIQNNMALFMCYLLKAYLAIVQSEEAKAVLPLKQALNIGSRNRYQGSFDWRPTVMAKLCHLALINDIEVDYVQSLIRKNNLIPEHSCSIATKYWPCPLRIYTLGRFAVEKEGELIIFNGKAQRRPMGLLKALIALGGRSVPEKRLSGVLWPDAEGDAAQQALATTLFRLRKLIGDDVIIRQDGKITLDAQHCWVDCWEFERLINKKQKHTSETFYRIKELYQAPFLTNEEVSWSFSFREKLHNKFIRAISDYARQLTKKGSHEQVAELYQWGLDIDDLVEDFYMGLMDTFIAQDKQSDAILVFNRCQKVFSSKLGIEPSTNTKLLFQTLSAQAE